MTKTELFTYYRENKNSMDEITLIGQTSRITYIFRHYTEMYTGESKWVRIADGTLYNTESLLKCFEKPFESKAFEGLKVGDIIVSVTAGDFKSYYKKIDEDVFIECDNEGNIKSCRYLQGFKHRITFIFNSEEIIELSDMVERGKGV